MAQDKCIEYEISEYVPGEEPFYVDVDGETEIFKAAYAEKIPLMLRGPTGCGKTRFLEKMIYDINQKRNMAENGNLPPVPLVTVPCHEDLTADDLKGRYLLSGEFLEGPALVAVRRGGILYLDEIVEARSDTTVVMHPLTDYRRQLVIEQLGKVFEPPDSMMVVVSYNPGYQRKSKDLKPSTKQRFVTLDFDYAPAEQESEIVTHESGVDDKDAKLLTEFAQHARRLKGQGLDEGASTRLLINAGKLIKRGSSPQLACTVAIINPLTEPTEVYADTRKGLEDALENLFPK